MSAMNEDIKKLIRELLRRHKLAVISTVTKDGSPEAAVIEFGETDDLKLVFDTFVTYRKYKNLQHNKRTAFVIGWDENITVQYEGDAYELSGEELERYKQLYFKKNPKAQKWESRPEIRYFKVTPRWIRHSNLNVNPWEIQEVDFAPSE